MGDLNKENEILSWISEELAKDEIKSVSRAVLDRSVSEIILLKKYIYLLLSRNK